MAAPTASDGNGGAGARYCLVSGIPAALRSAQLRAYFSQFVEAGGFLCFHYRHRPERPPAGGRDEAAAPRTCCCPVAVRPGRARRFVRMYSGKRWVGPGGSSLPGRCLIRRVRLSSGTGTSGHRGREGGTPGQASPHGPGRVWRIQWAPNPTPVGLVSQTEGTGWLKLLTESPSCFKFVVRQEAPAGVCSPRPRPPPRLGGPLIPPLCAGACVPSQNRPFSPPDTKTSPCSGDRASTGESVTEAALRRLPELTPPSFMPQGNVGTPLRVFLQLIRACRLPPRVITKLQLDFPKTGSSRRYGNVPFEYQDTETVIGEERVYTAAGDEITEEEEPVVRPEVTHPASAEEEEEEEEPHSGDVSGFFCAVRS